MAGNLKNNLHTTLRLQRKQISAHNKSNESLNVSFPKRLVPA